MRQPDRALSAFFYFIAFVFGAIMLLVVQSASGLQPAMRDDISTANFLAIILSALGVMVAILTFFLGVLAIFGWTAFRTIIEDKSESLFRNRFNANNPEYGALVEQLVEDARAQMAADRIAQAQSEEEPDPDEDEPPVDETK